jgi:hypothetical protein
VLLGAEFGGEVAGYLAGAREVVRIEGDGGNAGVAAAAESFGEGGEIFVGSGLVPGIGAQGDFGADGGRADADGIDAFRMQKIGNEFVVALEVEVADVKENDAVNGFGALAKNFDGAAMAFEERAEVFRDDGKFDHFGERAISELGNDTGGQAVFWSGFYDQAKLRGRLSEFDGGFRSGILRAVDDVAPVDEFFQRFRVEGEFFLGDGGDELGARFVVGLVEHVWAGMSAEMFGVRRIEKRALMVVEPPGHFGRVGILEIDDGVFVAVEKAGSPGLLSAMGHSCEMKLGGGIEFFLVETVEESGGSGPIKTAVMEAEPDSGHI